MLRHPLGMILSWDTSGISFSQHFDARHLLPSLAFSLKLFARGTMGEIATYCELVLTILLHL